MADERPDPAHTPPGSAGAVDPVPAATQADATGAPSPSPEPISPEEAAELTAALEARQSLSRALRDILALPARGKTTKRCTFAELQDPDHLIRQFEFWHHKRAHLAEATVIGLLIKVFERGPQAVTAFREICDRLEGPVQQKVAVTAEVKRVSAEPMTLEEWSTQALAAAKVAETKN